MSNSNTQRFWVIGGEYASMAFDSLKDGGRTVFGPFATHEEAKSVWKHVSRVYSSNALTRFSIASEGVAA